MDLSSLNSIAQSMVAPNKGILAADESTPTIGKRFASLTQNQMRRVVKPIEICYSHQLMFQIISVELSYLMKP